MENSKGDISKYSTVETDGVESSLSFKRKTEGSRQNISFTFTNKRNKTLVGNKLGEEETNAENTEDFVLLVENREVKSTKPREEKRDLVIPLIKKNTWRFPSSKTAESSAAVHEDEQPSGETLLNQMAIKELLQETSRENEKWENRSIPNETVMIPLIMQNKIPEGFETDDKLDVSLRPDISTIEDYEKVPIDSFGLAMLRGMGWKPGEAIGGKNKKCVAPVEVILRPKGLGLGADKQVLKKYKENQEERLVLGKGSYILVQQGSHKGLYGQVEGLDDENARVIIKLTGNDKCVTLPEFYIEVVSKKEFQKESKVINKSAYDKYAKVNEERKKDWIEKNSNEKKHHDYRSSKRRDEINDHANDSGGNTKSSHHHKKKRKHSKERSEKNYSVHNSQEHSESWVSAQLKVRVIDNLYKKGKYFNHKVVVEDILTLKSCICRTEDGKYLEDVQPSMLETVIPRSEPGYIMIVQGKYKGQLGVILKKNKVNCVATVQLLEDRQKVLNLGYDSICEYVGDVSQFD